MLVVLEGLPGAGKTTVLQMLGVDPTFTTIPEIIGSEKNDASEAFYIQNDVNKYKSIKPSSINVMDRNFASTLCYNFCHDKQFETTNYPRVLESINSGIFDGNLYHPDLYIRLVCPVSASLRRQNTTNDSVWSNKMFLQNVDMFYTNYLYTDNHPFVTINTASLPIEQVCCKVKSTIEKAYKNSGVMKEVICQS